MGFWDWSLRQYFVTLKTGSVVFCPNSIWEDCYLVSSKEEESKARSFIKKYLIIRNIFLVLVAALSVGLVWLEYSPLVFLSVSLFAGFLWRQRSLSCLTSSFKKAEEKISIENAITSMGVSRIFLAVVLSFCGIAWIVIASLRNERMADFDTWQVTKLTGVLALGLFLLWNRFKSKAK